MTLPEYTVAPWLFRLNSCQPLLGIFGIPGLAANVSAAATGVGLPTALATRESANPEKFVQTGGRMGGDPLVVVQAPRLIGPTATIAARHNHRLIWCRTSPGAALLGG